MRGNPHSYQSIAYGDPGYYPSKCEGDDCDREALEYDSDTDRNLCVFCFDEAEQLVVEEGKRS